MMGQGENFLEQLQKPRMYNTEKVVLSHVLN